MADPYAKAIIQNGLQQRLLSQRTTQIDAKKRKALNQIWFDRRAICQELVCIRAKTPSLSRGPTPTDLEQASLNRQQLSARSHTSTASDAISDVSVSTVNTTGSKSTGISGSTRTRTGDRLSRLRRQKSSSISPKTSKRIDEVKSINSNLERLSLATEQRAKSGHGHVNSGAMDRTVSEESDKKGNEESDKKKDACCNSDDNDDEEQEDRQGKVEDTSVGSQKRLHRSRTKNSLKGTKGIQQPRSQSS